MIKLAPYIPFMIWSFVPILLSYLGQNIYNYVILSYVSIGIAISLKGEWPLKLIKKIKRLDLILLLISSILQVGIDVSIVLTIISDSELKAISYMMGSLWSIPFFFVSTHMFTHESFKIKEIIIVISIGLGISLLYDLKFIYDPVMWFGLIRLISGCISAIIIKRLARIYVRNIYEIGNLKLLMGIPFAILTVFIMPEINPLNISSFIMALLGILSLYIGHKYWSLTIMKLSSFKISILGSISRSIIFTYFTISSGGIFTILNLIGLVCILIGNIAQFDYSQLFKKRKQSIIEIEAPE